jgi:uncharacterized RDD family membrane protein YckC
MITRTIRFTNFVIDLFVYFLLVLAVAYFLSPFFERQMLRWLLIAFYYLYYFLLELALGQTVGKMVTKTKVVSVEGKELSVRSILVRTFLRIVPVDIFSYLFSEKGFHDQYSGTMLIKKIEL